MAGSTADFLADRDEEHCIVWPEFHYQATIFSRMITIMNHFSPSTTATHRQFYTASVAMEIDCSKGKISLLIPAPKTNYRRILKVIAKKLDIIAA